MNVSRMRWADRWLGIPTCAVLTLFRRLQDPIHSRRPLPLRRILFVKLAEQGSTVLAAPAISQAVEMVGRDNVFFLVFEENRFILDAMELIPEQNVVTIPTGSISSAVGGALRAVRRLRKEHLDAAINLEFFARSSAALSWLSGAPQRVGFHAFAGEASYRGDLMTHRLSFNPHLHTSQTFYVMVEALNCPPEQLPALALQPPLVNHSPPSFKPQAREVGEVNDLLRRVTGRLKVGPLILLNANCSDLLPLRRWPTANYIDLARRLLGRYAEVYVALTGASEETADGQRLAKEIGSARCFSLAGRTTLRQLLVLYSVAEVLVTNDSGPAHFATLTPIDVVTLFGPETPKLFAAQSPRNHVLWAGVACSPCVNAYNDRQSFCPDNVCMQRITVDQVCDQVCAVYERRTR
ncbi:MAG: glycosyltransferase family 9 protein [Planctomycetota bacterium]